MSDDIGFYYRRDHGPGNDARALVEAANVQLVAAGEPPIAVVETGDLRARLERRREPLPPFFKRSPVLVYTLTGGAGARGRAGVDPRPVVGLLEGVGNIRAFLTSIMGALQSDSTERRVSGHHTASAPAPAQHVEVPEELMKIMELRRTNGISKD